MDMNKTLINLVYLFTLINGFVVKDNNDKYQITEDINSDNVSESKYEESDNPVNVFNGVYTECFFQLSYTCLQRKTLLYLKELNRLKEISVIGDYVKFVKLNGSENFNDYEEISTGQNTDELAYMIDKAVDKFFDNHLIRFSALGKDVLVPNQVEEFVGRKKRKGGGGGGGGHGGGDDGGGGKKKFMMMAMMCMKMKLMMMVPAMMGMMGMMSFKGMMFSMMSFMISKMMLLMKILEKKGGGAGGGGGDGGWAAGGGSGGAWMPTGPDYGGGGGGGYDANGQWQSRSMIEDEKEILNRNDDLPIISYVKPIIRYNSKIRDIQPLLTHKTENDITKRYESKAKSRKKRGIIDVIQNAYLYWANKVLGIGKKRSNHPNYKVVNGIKYVYYPVRSVKVKSPKELQSNAKENETKAIADDFNKGEIVEVPAESRMIRKKFHKMKENVNETVEENPWE